MEPFQPTFDAYTFIPKFDDKDSYDNNRFFYVCKQCFYSKDLLIFLENGNFNEAEEYLRKKGSKFHFLDFKRYFNAYKSKEHSFEKQLILNSNIYAIFDYLFCGIYPSDYININ